MKFWLLPAGKGKSRQLWARLGEWLSTNEQTKIMKSRALAAGLGESKQVADDTQKN